MNKNMQGGYTIGVSRHLVDKVLGCVVKRSQIHRYRNLALSWKIRITNAVKSIYYKA